MALGYEQHASSVSLEHYCVCSRKIVCFFCVWSYVSQIDGVHPDSQGFHVIVCSLLALGSGVLGAVFMEVKKSAPLL